MGTFFWSFPFRAKITPISSKNAQLERNRSIGKWFWCVSAHFRSFPADFRSFPADFRSFSGRQLAKSSQNLKRAKTMPRDLKSDQMEDPGMQSCSSIETRTTEQCKCANSHCETAVTSVRVAPILEPSMCARRFSKWEPVIESSWFPFAFPTANPKEEKPPGPCSQKLHSTRILRNVS